MSIDDYDPNFSKPKSRDFNDYKGMSKDSEIEYQKRQNEPLFKNSREMVPMEQLKQHFENLKCGFKGCNGLVKDKSFYACIWHQAMQAVGTDFFWYYKFINDNDLERMTAYQHTALEQRYAYMQRWLDNFPKGTTR